MKKIFLIFSFIFATTNVLANNKTTYDYSFYLKGGYESTFNISNTILDNSDFYKDKQIQSNNYFGGLGVRLFDFLRLEGLYFYENDDNLKILTLSEELTGKIRSDVIMANIYFDARLNSFSKWLVPYIGFGGGISYNDISKVKNESGTIINVTYSDKNYVLSAMVGLGIQFSNNFILDLGYQYKITSSVDLDISGITTLNDMTRYSHNLQAGFRIEF